MAINNESNNCVSLNGADMFCYFITHFDMTGAEAIKEMSVNNQDLTWFNNYPLDKKNFILSDEFKTEYINTFGVDDATIPWWMGRTRTPWKEH